MNMENKVELKFGNKVENNDSTTVVADEVSVATKKITVQEFVDTYKKTPERQKEAYLKSLVVTDYVPFEMKVALTQDIVQRTHMENGKVFVRTPLCEALFMMMLLREYTNIKLDKDNTMDDFNMLNKYSLIDLILMSNAIPEAEVSEFQTILDMLKVDFMTNNCRIYSVINNGIDRVSDIVNALFQPAIDKISNITEADVNEFVNSDAGKTLLNRLRKINK